MGRKNLGFVYKGRRENQDVKGIRPEKGIRKKEERKPSSIAKSIKSVS